MDKVTPHAALGAPPTDSPTMLNPRAATLTRRVALEWASLITSACATRTVDVNVSDIGKRLA
jgi:hypothetical protein